MTAKRAGAYLTVYLTLSLTAVLSLFLTLIEGARMNAIRMQMECVTDIAMNSVLAEFHRALYEQYDLFFVDTSYGSGAPALGNTAERLRMYMEKNYTSKGLLSFGGRRDFTALSVADLDVTAARYITDGGEKALREQVYAYMAADPAGALLGQVLTQVDTFQGLLHSSGRWQDEREDNEQDIGEKGTPTITDEEGNEIEVPLHNPAAAVNSFRQSAVLTQIFGSSAALSDAAIERGDRLSARGFPQRQAWEAENTHGYPEADALLFDQYIFEKCGTYRAPLDKSRLKYQVEYILFGKASDRENLADTATALLVCREAANCLYLFTDQAKCAEADLMAGALAAVVLLPELQPLVKVSILFAWAYLESVQDVKTLFAGGKVPLLKDGQSWRTSLSGILTPERATQGQNGGDGLNYETYLRMMLYLEKAEDKNVRLLEIMESDVRQTPGNERFRIEGCLDGYRLRVAVRSGFGYTYALERGVSYN